MFSFLYKPRSKFYSFNMDNLFRKNIFRKINYSDYFVKKYEKYIFFEKPKYFDLTQLKESLENIEDEDKSIEMLKNENNNIEIFDEYIVCSGNDNNNNRNIKILMFLSVSSFLFYFLRRKYMKI